MPRVETRGPKIKKESELVDIIPALHESYW